MPKRIDYSYTKADPYMGNCYVKKFQVKTQPLRCDVSQNSIWCVTLHSTDVWNYRIQADVQATNGKSITATVVDIFDQDAGAQVLGGDITKLVGTTLTVC